MQSKTSGEPILRAQPSRRRIEIRGGALVRHPEGVFRIDEVLDFATVTATSLETGRARVLRIGELQDMGADPQPMSDVDIDAIEQDDWRVAQTRYAAIQPLLESGENSRTAVVARAMELGVSPATLYRWLSRYRGLDAVSGLIPQKRGWRHGNGRIPAALESVIREVIDNFYLTPERPTAQKVVREVHRLCEQRGMSRPSATAIRARIEKIPEYQRLSARGQREKAKNKYLATPGSTPNSSYTLESIQIDHTPFDVIVVDDEHRLPIGRPWLTLAIDQFSRMVVGYYLSFDAPSTTSVGMCLASAMLPKDGLLIQHQIESSWPVWGRPTKVRCDNGPDFRSESLRQSCALYSIDIEFRPVKVPRYGGYIERIQGTLLRELHDLPGSTFSSVAHRGEYDSDGRAVMTKSELEHQLLLLICNEYHRRPHSALGMPPLRKWELGIFGGAGHAGSGLPPRPISRTTVYLDFLPMYERTVQADGVSIDGLRYYGDILRQWIGAKDQTTGRARKHIFRRDPRDISAIWFYDGQVKEYFQIPTANQAFPSCSTWEYEKAQEETKRAGFDSSDDRAVLRSINERRALVEKHMAKTKSVRREAQRRIEHQKSAKEVVPTSVSTKRADRDLSPRPSCKPGTSFFGGLVSNIAASEDIE